MVKIKDFEQEPEVRAYVIYVFHNWRLSNESVNANRDYLKRNPETIKGMENVRQRLHYTAMDFLKAKGFSETEISIFLEDECEKETKRKLPELDNGENYCGCCRMKVKTSQFDKHTQTKLHKLLDEEVYSINMLYQQIKYSVMAERMNNGRANN